MCESAPPVGGGGGDVYDFVKEAKNAVDDDDAETVATMLTRRLLREVLDMTRVHERHNRRRAAAAAAHENISENESSVLRRRSCLKAFAQYHDCHVCVSPLTATRDHYNTKPCQLWRANAIMIFPTIDIHLNRENERFAALEQSDKDITLIIADELYAKACVPVSAKQPLHSCVSVSTDGELRSSAARAHINVCDERNRMQHCKIFEQLLYDSYCDAPCVKNVLGASVHVDCVRDAYPYELQNEAYDRGEQSRVLRLKDHEIVQNSLTARIVSGAWVARDFAGRVGLDVRLRFVVVQDCFFCPEAPFKTLIHDCTLAGCMHHDSVTGEATCSLTRLSLQSVSLRLRNAYLKQGEREDVPCYDRRQSINLRNAVQRDDRHDRAPVDRTSIEDDVELRQDIEHYFDEEQKAAANRRSSLTSSALFNVDDDDDDNDNDNDNTNTVDRRRTWRKGRRRRRDDISTALTISGQNAAAAVVARDQYHELLTTKSDRFARRNKRAKTYRRQRLQEISVRSKEARKLLNTKHLSTPREYIREAEFRIGTLVCADDVRARASMSQVMTERVHRKTLSGASPLVRDEHGRRIIKWYTIPEREQLFLEKAERREKQNDGVVVHVKVFRDSAWLKKVIADNVRALALKCVLFWTLLRTRTQYARDNPNEFAITAFSVAFAYAAKHGLYVSDNSAAAAAAASAATGGAISSGREYVISKQRFLQLALPDVKDLKEVHYSFDKKRTQRCKNSILTALRTHCTQHKNYSNTISPEAPDNASLNLDAVAHAHPELFHGIMRKRNKER